MMMMVMMLMLMLMILMTVAMMMMIIVMLQPMTFCVIEYSQTITNLQYGLSGDMNIWNQTEIIIISKKKARYKFDFYPDMIVRNLILLMPIEQFMNLEVRTNGIKCFVFFLHYFI